MLVREEKDTRGLKYPAGVFWVLTCAWIALDQAVKYVQRTSMNVGDTIPVISNVFHFTYVHNTGAAFSSFSGRVGLFVAAAVLMLVGIALFWRYEKPRDVLPVVATALISAGAIGNAVDRVAWGYVIDIFDARIINFAVFNVADAGISIGVVLALVWIMFYGGLREVEKEDA